MPGPPRDPAAYEAAVEAAQHEHVVLYPGEPTPAGFRRLTRDDIERDTPSPDPAET